MTEPISGRVWAVVGLDDGERNMQLPPSWAKAFWEQKARADLAEAALARVTHESAIYAIAERINAVTPRDSEGYCKPVNPHTSARAAYEAILALAEGAGR